MNYSYSINTLLPLLALLISLGLAVRALRLNTRRLSVIFITLMLAVSLWSLAVMMENSSLVLATKIVWLQISYLPVVFIPIIWFIFTMQFTGRQQWLTWRNSAILAVLPVTTIVMAWTNDFHHLMWQDIRLAAGTSQAAAVVTNGPWFWVHSVYSYALLLVSIVILVRSFQKSRGAHRKQARLLIIAALAPWFANTLFVAGIGPLFVFDPTPLVFAMTGIAILFTLSTLQLMEIMPVARDEIFKSMIDGAIVLDHRQRVVDINPAAQSMLGCNRAATIGKPYNLVMPGPAAFLEFKPDMGVAQAEIAIGENEAQRFYRLDISSIEIRPDIFGHLIIMGDDTNRRQAEVESRERIRLQTELIERDKAAEAIQHQLDVEQAIAGLSSRFVGIQDIKEAVKASLHDLGQLNKTSVVCLVLLPEYAKVAGETNQCMAAGMISQTHDVKGLASPDCSWWAAKLSGGGFIRINDVTQMPPEAATEKDILKSQGVKSALVYPVFVKNILSGFLGFDNITDVYKWTDSDLIVLRMSSEIIGNAIERQMTLDRLADLVEELRSLNAQLEVKVEDRTKEITEALATAKASSQAKSEFLASMSHELRTPLNAVIGFSQMLHEQYFGSLNEKQSEYVMDIMDSGKHLLSLINDILDLSKIEAGKMELEISIVNPGELLRNSLVMVKEKALVHNISLEVKIADDADELKIRADERRLKQVLFNLLSNAVKFTPRGGNITVEARKDADELLVSVTDTGIGITPIEQKRIFEAFYQGSGGLKDKTPGTGLGLPITRSIVEKHGGRIWVESGGSNMGSRFSFTLPLLGPSVSEDETHEER